MSKQSQGKERKENLVWKLDMLEAKATRSASSTRLVRSQFAANKELRKIQKRERKDQVRSDQFENPNRADMIAEQMQQESGPMDISPEDQAIIKALRVKIFEQKLHHYSKEIHRGLKTAKTTEALKIGKRIKKEEGNEEKIKKLQDELAELKTIDVALITSLHAAKFMKKSFLATSEQRENPPDFLPDSIVNPAEDSITVTFHKTASPALVNVVARLCGTAAVKTACQSLLTAVKYAMKIEKKETAADIAKRKNQERKEKRAKAKAANRNEASSNHNKGSDSEDLDQYKGMIAASSDEESDFEEEQTKESILGTSRAPKRVIHAEEDDDDEEDEDEDEVDDFFVFPDEDIADKAKDKTTSVKSAKPATTTTTQQEKFVLPALASGYFSGGSDDEEMEDDDSSKPRDRGYNLEQDEVVKQATTQRKNRRGQQARRAIYEKKFGNKANHIQKEKEDKQRKWAERQAEFEKREARRKELGIEHPKQRTLPELPEKLQPLHPSWEAKKKLSSAQVKFEGKKIVF